MKYLSNASALALVILFVLGCSKSAEQNDNLKNQVDLDPKSTIVTDLGVVELLPQVANRFKLKVGKECVLTPTVLPDGNLKIEVSVEAKNELGIVKQLGKARTVTPPNQQFTVSVGDSIIGLTPKMKSN
jgi:hypothetical protein